MMLQKEHTLCEDPLTKAAAVLSEFDLILLFSLVSNGIQLQQTGTYDLNEM